jgi:hypothetical protein
MTPIEQIASKLCEELLGPENLFVGNDFQDALAIITRHLTTHTQFLEEENKRLREALELIIKFFVSANNYPDFDKEPSKFTDMATAETLARAALTKPT